MGYSCTNLFMGNIENLTQIDFEYFFQLDLALLMACEKGFRDVVDCLLAQGSIPSKVVSLKYNFFVPITSESKQLCCLEVLRS